MFHAHLAPDMSEEKEGQCGQRGKQSRGDWEITAERQGLGTQITQGFRDHCKDEAEGEVTGRF